MVKSLRDLLISDRFPIGAVQKPKTVPTELDAEGKEAGEAPESDLNSNSKKVLKFKRDDFTNAKIDSIGPIRKNTTDKRSKRRFVVDLKFHVGDKRHERQVLFGKEGKEEFIDHKDEARRLSTITKIGHTDNPFHPNFWKAYILNSKYDNIPDAHRALVENMEPQEHAY